MEEGESTVVIDIGNHCTKRRKLVEVMLYAETPMIFRIVYGMVNDSVLELSMKSVTITVP